MENYQEKNPEPPELRKQGIPPLRKTIKLFVIGLIIAFIIVLAFVIIFWYRDR